MLDYNVTCNPVEFSCGKVTRMIGLSGCPVRNHWLIDMGHGIALQSYNSIVAFKFVKDFGRFKAGTILLDRGAWDYSATTARYRRIFLGEGKAETVKKIESKEYELVGLNFVNTFDGLTSPVDYY